MKKILCIALSLVLALSFAACGKSKQTGGNPASGENIVDQKTVAIVNKAFGETKKALESAVALGYKFDMVTRVTADSSTTSTRQGTEHRFIKGDVLKASSSTVIKSEKTDSELFLYTDGASIYGSTAGTTYNITSTEDAKKYFADLTAAAKIYDASSVAPVNTRIVDTSNGGYGFVLDYPVDQLPEDFNKLFGEALKNYGEKAKGVSLKVSGIIDDKGRLETETVTYTFNYDYETDNPDADPDNGESAQSNKLTKTASVSISAQMDFDYGVTEIKPYDEIVVPSTDSGITLKELSLTDFRLLASAKSTDSEE